MKADEGRRLCSSRGMPPLSLPLGGWAILQGPKAIMSACKSVSRPPHHRMEGPDCVLQRECVETKKEG